MLVDWQFWHYLPVCVKTASKIKYIKSHYRSTVDEHFQLTLMIQNTNFESQLSKMLSSPLKEVPSSHDCKKLYSITVLQILFNAGLSLKLQTVCDMYVCVVCRLNFIFQWQHAIFSSKFLLTTLLWNRMSRE